MKTAFQIFRRDVRRLLKNRAATLVMIGVCLLPSLYAWFNIAANMESVCKYFGNQGGNCQLRYRGKNRCNHDECRRFDC